MSIDFDSENPRDSERRNRVLARIEAALRAERLSVIDLAGDDPGGDPYNKGTARAAANDRWNPALRRR